MIWIKLLWVRKLYFSMSIDCLSVWNEFGESGIKNGPTKSVVLLWQAKRTVCIRECTTAFFMFSILREPIIAIPTRISYKLTWFQITTTFSFLYKYESIDRLFLGMKHFVWKPYTIIVCCNNWLFYQRVREEMEEEIRLRGVRNRKRIKTRVIIEN